LQKIGGESNRNIHQIHRETPAKNKMSKIRSFTYSVPVKRRLGHSIPEREKRDKKKRFRELTREEDILLGGSAGDQ